MEHFNGRQSSPQTWSVLDWAFLFCFKGRGGGSDAIKSVFSALNLTWIWGFFVNLTKLFLRPTTFTGPWARARNSLAKEAAKTQGVVITLCYHIHRASAKAALPPGEQGHGVAREEHLQLTAQALMFYFIPSLCYSFMIVQGCEGSMQKNFCTAFSFGKQTWAMYSGGRKARSSFTLTGGCAVTQQAQPWEGGEALWDPGWFISQLILLFLSSLSP